MQYLESQNSITGFHKEWKEIHVAHKQETNKYSPVYTLIKSYSLVRNPARTSLFHFEFLHSYFWLHDVHFKIVVYPRITCTRTTPKDEIVNWPLLVEILWLKFGFKIKIDLQEREPVCALLIHWAETGHFWTNLHSFLSHRRQAN